MAEFTITPNEVHVWSLRLNDSRAEPEETYESLLSEDERDRAEKLRFKEDRRRFILARGNLRLLLSRYLNKKPRQLWIRYGRYGKPYLSEESNPKKISFNLSHSKDTVLYAFSYDRKIGIDIEFLRPVSKAGKIVERFFSEEEISYYNSQDSESKNEKFFKLWCSREAYSKALGSGLHLPRGDISISFVSGKFKKNIEETKDHAEIRLYELSADKGYTAYLAASGSEPEIILRDLNSI